MFSRDFEWEPSGVIKHGNGKSHGNLAGGVWLEKIILDCYIFQISLNGWKTKGRSSRSYHSGLIFLYPGHHVCKVAWMHLLGVGKKRLSRCKKTCYGKDGRSTFGRNLMNWVWQLPFDFGFGLTQYYTSKMRTAAAHHHLITQDLPAGVLTNLPQCELSLCICIGLLVNQWLQSTSSGKV